MVWFFIYWRTYQVGRLKPFTPPELLGIAWVRLAKKYSLESLR